MRLADSRVRALRLVSSLPSAECLQVCHLPHTSSEGAKMSNGTLQIASLHRPSVCYLHASLVKVMLCQQAQSVLCDRLW